MRIQNIYKGENMIEYQKVKKNKSLRKSPKTVVLSTRIEELQLAALEMIAKKNNNISVSQLLKIVVEEFLASAIESMETIHIESAMDVLDKYIDESCKDLDRYDDYRSMPIGIRDRLKALFTADGFHDNIEIELGYIFKDTLKFEKTDKMQSLIEKYDEIIFPKELIANFSLENKESD